MAEPLVEGMDYYREGAFLVFTEAYHRRRGYCCESGCRHCPYGFRRNAMRIVSLLPSATEIICSLGLREQLVGVTHECDFPESVTALPKETRTCIPANATSSEIDAMVSERAKSRLPLYELDAEKLATLNPDLIVTQALCDVCAVDESQVQAAARVLPGKPQIVNLEPTSLQGVFDAMRTVAIAAQIPDEGKQIIDALRQRVAAIVGRYAQTNDGRTVAFLEWLDPFFCGGHWNPELVHLAGGRELIGQSGARSRRIDWSELQQADPEIIFIACCGFSIERTQSDLARLAKNPQWNALRAVRNGRVHIADGNAYFNRPGPRLVDSLEILADAIHGRAAGDTPDLRIKCAAQL